ncbi:MAG TPA: (Fe-S)-binding protein [bacterium]|nr:(Fe-S)-binding protein [bacterium]
MSRRKARPKAAAGRMKPQHRTPAPSGARGEPRPSVRGSELRAEIEAKGINLFECYTCRLCTEEMQRGILTLTEPYRKAYGETEWRRDLFNEPVCPTWDYYRHEAYTAYGRALLARDLADGLEVAPDDSRMQEVVYTCLLCTGCQELCFSRNRVPLMKEFMTLPREVWDLHGILLAERKWLFDRYGWEIVPEGLRTLAQRLLATGTVTGDPKAHATRWLEATGTDVVDLSRGGRVDVLLLLDARAPYDRTLWPALAASVRLIRAAGFTVGTLGDEEIATAMPVLAAGDVRGYLDLNRAAIDKITRMADGGRVGKVVTVDDTGYQAWTAPPKHYGPPQRPRFPFTHIVPFLAALLKEGRLTFAGAVDEEVVLLDGCHLGRYGKVLDPPREILAQIPGVRVREAHLRREYLYCCGASAGAPEAFPEQATWWGRKRLAQAAEVLTSGRIVVTTSLLCGAHLRRIAAADGRLEIKDLTEIAAAALT